MLNPNHHGALIFVIWCPKFSINTRCATCEIGASWTSCPACFPGLARSPYSCSSAVPCTRPVADRLRVSVKELVHECVLQLQEVRINNVLAILDATSAVELAAVATFDPP